MKQEPIINDSIKTIPSPARNNVLIVYILLLLGFVTGIFWLIGGIWALIKSPIATNTIWASHYKNVLLVFWWGFGLFTLSILAIITLPMILGIALFFLTSVWVLYRLIKGLSLLADNKSFN